MEEILTSSIFFNKLKLKYSYINDYFQFPIKEEKTFYFFIDFDYIIRMFMHSIQCEDFRYIDANIVDNFTVGLLNLISHYKNFFYKHCDSLSYFYIGVDRKQYAKFESMTEMFRRLVSTANMIPRINFYYCESVEQKFYLKYNLIRTIKTIKGPNHRTVFIDICKPYMNELIYCLTKDYHLVQYHQKDPTGLYGFNNFKEDYLTHVPDIYMNTVLKLLPVYEALDTLEIHGQKRIDKVIMDFIIKNKDKHLDYNLEETKELALKLFTSKRRAINKLRKINRSLTSPVYQNMMTTIIKSWKNVIKDNSIYKINEMLNIPDNCRINIELLMNY